jgi:hypothetical protein
MRYSSGQQAAAALNGLLPQKDRVKTVARLFECSARMAAYLLAGDHWTSRRFAQASELLGDAFDTAFSRPDNAFLRNIEDQRIDARIMRLEHHLEQMARRLDVTLASIQDAPPHEERRDSRSNIRHRPKSTNYKKAD